jgi:hypothetical protein
LLLPAVLQLGSYPPQPETRRRLSNTTEHLTLRNLEPADLPHLSRGANVLTGYLGIRANQAPEAGREPGKSKLRVAHYIEPPVHLVGNRGTPS